MNVYITETLSEIKIVDQEADRPVASGDLDLPIRRGSRRRPRLPHRHHVYDVRLLQHFLLLLRDYLADPRVVSVVAIEKNGQDHRVCLPLRHRERLPNTEPAVLRRRLQGNTGISINTKNNSLSAFFFSFILT